MNSRCKDNMEKSENVDNNSREHQKPENVGVCLFPFAPSHKSTSARVLEVKNSTRTTKKVIESRCLRKYLTKRDGHTSEGFLSGRSINCSGLESCDIGSCFNFT